MGDQMSVWFFIVLVCLPSIIVFVVCYLLIKQFLKNREEMERLDILRRKSGKILPLKLQAYERLVLLFERIDVPAMIAKLKRKKMSSGDLQSALMIAIQQEFEHNVTQQIYVSDKLWEVLRLSKTELFNQLHQVMIKTAFSEDVDSYSNALIEHFSQPEHNITQRAIYAIKQEAKLHL